MRFVDCRFEDLGMESRLGQGYFASLQRSDRPLDTYKCVPTLSPVSSFHIAGVKKVK